MSVSKMKKLTVFAFRKDSDLIIRRLMNLRCVDIRQSEQEREVALSRQTDTERRLTEAESKLDRISEALPILAKYATRKHGITRRVLRVNREEFAKDGRAEKAFGTVEETLAVKAKLDGLVAAQTQTREQMEALLPWQDLDGSLSDLSTQRTVTVLGTFPIGVKQDLLETALEENAVEAEFVSADKIFYYYTLTYLKDDESEIGQLLASYDFLRTDLPAMEGTARHNLDALHQTLQQLEEQFLSTEEKLRDLAEIKDDAEILSDLIETEIRMLQFRLKLGETGHCTILEGWIPTAAMQPVQETLDGFECAYELEEPTEEEQPPVLLRNNRFAVNFEWVIGMYSYPKYGTFDPTFIMSIFYFLIFGLMFADVGYGLILSIACFAGIKLLNPRQGLKRSLLMFGFCGISCAIMGVLFGGWFGDLPTAIFGEKAGTFFSQGLLPMFNPLENPMGFLLLSLGVGAIHLIAGMAIKFFILCKDGSPLEAICTILPFWVLFAGFGVLVFNRQIGLYVTLAGAVLILLLNGYGIRNPFKRLIKGLGGLYGLINYASDLLSYSRILALGMVAVVIAKVINMITALGGKGPIGFLFMLIVLLLGHGLNIAINLLGTFVHTARLQYIEFFGKFYEDGGDPFQPALPADQYSEDSSIGSNLKQ